MGRGRHAAVQSDRMPVAVRVNGGAGDGFGGQVWAGGVVLHQFAPLLLRQFGQRFLNLEPEFHSVQHRTPVLVTNGESYRRTVATITSVPVDDLASVLSRGLHAGHMPELIDSERHAYLLG